MKFKKLEMMGMKNLLGFCVQRAWVKLQEIIREGKFNAAATIQARVRGGIVRRIMRKVIQESSKRSQEILTAERRKRVQMREAEIVRECTRSMILEVVDCTSESIEVKLPDVLVELGRSRDHGFQLDARIRGGKRPEEGVVDIAVIIKSVKPSREEQEIMDKALKEGWEDGAVEMVSVGAGSTRKVIEGLVPDNLYHVHLNIPVNTKRNLIQVMEKENEGILQKKEGEWEEKALEKAKVLAEGVMDRMRRSSTLDMNNLMQAQKLAKEVAKAGQKALMDEKEREMMVLKDEEESAEPEEGDKVWEKQIKMKR